MKKQTWHTINRKRSRMIKKWIRLMKSEYIKFGVPIVNEIRQSGVGNIDDFIENQSSNNITDTLMKLYLDVGGYFANESYEAQKAYIPKMHTKDFLQDKWVLTMVQFAENEGFEIFSSIRQTPKDEAKRIVKKIIAFAAESGLAIDGDWNVPNLADMVANAFRSEWGKAAGWMGRRVAQTETIRASNYSTLEGVKGLGVPFQKAWLVARDGKERETHAIAGDLNTNISEDGPFMVAGYACMYPSDPVLPVQETVNCRCAVTAFPVEF